MEHRTVYLDNNATTMVAPEVREAMLPFFGELYGNPSSMHAFGGEIAKYVASAREEVAAFLNCSPDEVLFTSCATESDNSAIRGSADWYGKSLKVITSKVEHPAVLQPCRRLKALGHDVTEIGVDNLGNINLDELRENLKGTKNALVSIMWANNETGVISPIDEIASICKEYGATFHTDAVQVAGKIPVDVSKTPVDMLSMSGHKFHAPKGIGIFYVRRGTKIKPFMLGGHQESGRRAGTENVPYIVGIAKACELARKGMADEAVKLTRLRDRLEAGLLASCPDTLVKSRTTSPTSGYASPPAPRAHRVRSIPATSYARWECRSSLSTDRCASRFRATTRMRTSTTFLLKCRRWSSTFATFRRSDPTRTRLRSSDSAEQRNHLTLISINRGEGQAQLHRPALVLVASLRVPIARSAGREERAGRSPRRVPGRCG